MKKVLVAVACTLGAVACGGDKKPAESAADVTEMTSTVTPPATPAPPPTPATPLAAPTDTTAMPNTSVMPPDMGSSTVNEGRDNAITAAVRTAVTSDMTISTEGKSVRIITKSGKVTLRGPVKSDAEKAAIESKAKSTAGVTEVDNELEVKK